MNFRFATFALALLVSIAAIIFASPKYIAAARSFAQKFSQGAVRRDTSAIASQAILSNSASLNMTAKTPIYFLSHGGPNIMYDKEHPVFSQLQKIGKEITEKVKPKAVVVFSAHWQGEPNVIEINTSENTNLIYEFVPRRPNHHSPNLKSDMYNKYLTGKKLLRFPTTLLQRNIPQQRLPRGRPKSNRHPLTIRNQNPSHTSRSRPRRLGLFQSNLRPGNQPPQCPHHPSLSLRHRRSGTAPRSRKSSIISPYSGYMYNHFRNGST